MCPILSYQNIATLTPVYHFSKKNRKILGGGLNPLNPPPLNTPLSVGHVTKCDTNFVSC